MEKIIKNIADANKYHFKAFDNFSVQGSSKPKYSEILQDTHDLERNDYTLSSVVAQEPKQPPQPPPQPIVQNTPPVSAPQPPSPPQQVPQQNELVENLLKKIDELSTNMVKMEMQMERQQADFNARLDAERAQAKELGATEARAQMEANYQAGLANMERIVSSSVKKLDENANNFVLKIDEIEKELTQTALHLASEVIKQEVLERSALLATNLATELIGKLKDAAQITIKVNQDDFNTVNAELGSSSKITVQADEAVSKGGVIILSDSGNLDGQLSARLEKIKHEALS